MQIYKKSLLSKINVKEKKHRLSTLFILDFKDLKKHALPSFFSPLFIAIIDIFHIVSKNILGNSETNPEILQIL
jgi:hypothetical protein